MPVSCCLAEMIKEKIDLTQTCAVHKNIIFSPDVPDNLCVLAGKSMLKLILPNLLSKAIKYSRTNGTGYVSARQQNSMVKISVEDNGMGMNKKTLSGLFALDHMSQKKGTFEKKALARASYCARNM